MAVGGVSNSTVGVTGQSGKRKKSVNLKPRGRNKVRQVATLQAGQKLEDKFQGDGIEHRCKDIMNKARQRWNTWWGDLNRFHLKNKSSIEDTKKSENLPKGLFQDESEWLVSKHYTYPKFLGAKNEKEPTIVEIFDATNTLEEEHDKIMEESSKNPSISQFELVEKRLGVHDRGRITCFGFGMKPKDHRGPEPSKAGLKAQLQEKDQVIAELTSRVETIEQLEVTRQKEIVQKQATQEREIGELHKEIKMLKELYFQLQSAP